MWYQQVPTGAGVVDKLINRLPVEMHLPNDTPKAWSMTVNRVDQCCRRNLCYAWHKDTTARNSICDKVMLASLNAIPKPTAGKRLYRSIVNS